MLVIKDLTSVLSMNRETRAEILAALREIHDGHWVRYLGTDGGRTLEWSGRLVVIGAVTTAWDQAHGVVATMGDRFVLIRTGRADPWRQARRNVDHEDQMRTVLADAEAGMMAGVDLAAPEPDDGDIEQLGAAADFATLARTAVVTDPRGDVVDAHAPEASMRFVKQLVQLVRGAMALGMSSQRATALALRCARDSVPPLRLAVLEDLAAYPGSTIYDVRKASGQAQGHR